MDAVLVGAISRSMLSAKVSIDGVSTEVPPPPEPDPEGTLGGVTGFGLSKVPWPEGRVVPPPYDCATCGGGVGGFLLGGT